MEMKIVVGVDGSEPASRAVQWCAKYAGTLEAEVIVVHAIDIPMDAPVVDLDVSPPVLIPSPSQEYRAELREHIRAVWCAPLANANVPYRVVVMEIGPAPSIMEVAQTEQADLVVTGRRGRGGIAELVLGSTSHTLTHHLDRPMVIVP